MRRQLLPGLLMVVVLTVLLGVIYPLAVTGISQVAFSDTADGSLIERDGEFVGSRLIGQPFDGEEWFHPRPSAAGEGYDPRASSGSNLGPNNPDLLTSVEERVAAYRDINGLPEEVKVPVDAVTASASGLDPHISIANAKLQAPRVAKAREIDIETVLEMLDESIDHRSLFILGEDGVNVLELNLAIEELG